MMGWYFSDNVTFFCWHIFTPNASCFFLPADEAIPVVSRSNIESEGIWERRDRLNAQAAQRQDTWVEQMAVDAT